jgi:hypothetical protein
MHGSRTSAHEQDAAAKTRHSRRRHTCPCARTPLARVAPTARPPTTDGHTHAQRRAKLALPNLRPGTELLAVLGVQQQQQLQQQQSSAPSSPRSRRRPTSPSAASPRAGPPLARPPAAHPTASAARVSDTHRHAQLSRTTADIYLQCTSGPIRIRQRCCDPWTHTLCVFRALCSVVGVGVTVPPSR